MEGIMPTTHDMQHGGKRKKIGEILIEQKTITKDQLEGALQEVRIRQEKIGHVLVRNDFCSELDIANALAIQSGKETINLYEKKIEYIPTTKEIEKMLRNNYIIIKKEDSGGVLTLHIAIDDPNDLQKKKQIESAFVKKINPIYYIAPTTDIYLKIKATFKDFHFRSNINKYLHRIDELQSRPQVDDDEQNRLVSSIFDELLQEAVYEKRDDIHIEVIDDLTRVKFKKGKYSNFKYVFAQDIGKRLCNYIRNTANLPTNIMVHADGAMRRRVVNRYVDLRVSRIITVGSDEESMNMRILDRAKVDIRFEKLGFHEQDVKYFKNISKIRQGLVIFYGPTGSGKSTSMYALLKEISGYSNKIVTVEDPVEYRSPTITQVQVNEKAGMGFAQTLRSFLRHAPDVILIGEIRDAETANIALQAANTGHLVLTTVHAKNADLVKDRLSKLGADASILDEVLLTIVGQIKSPIFCEICENYNNCQECIPQDKKYQVIYEIKDFTEDEDIYPYADNFEKCKEFKRKQLDAVVHA